MLDRIPPQSIEAEQSVLGAMMIEKEAISKVAEMLKPEDFYRESHRLVFQAVVALFNRNEAVDIITVTEQLRKEDKLEGAGGIAYVTSLANAMPTQTPLAMRAPLITALRTMRKKSGPGLNKARKCAPAITRNCCHNAISFSTREMGAGWPFGSDAY